MTRFLRCARVQELNCWEDSTLALEHLLERASAEGSSISPGQREDADEQHEAADGAKSLPESPPKRRRRLVPVNSDDDKAPVNSDQDAKATNASPERGTSAPPEPEDSAAALPFAEPPPAGQMPKPAARATVKKRVLTVAVREGDFEIGDDIEGHMISKDGVKKWYPGVVVDKKGCGRHVKYVCDHWCKGQVGRPQWRHKETRVHGAADMKRCTDFDWCLDRGKRLLLCSLSVDDLVYGRYKHGEGGVVVCMCACARASALACLSALVLSACVHACVRACMRTDFKLPTVMQGVRA